MDELGAKPEQKDKTFTLEAVEAMIRAAGKSQANEQEAARQLKEQLEQFREDALAESLVNPANDVQLRELAELAARYVEALPIERDRYQTAAEAIYIGQIEREAARVGNEATFRENLGLNAEAVAIYSKESEALRSERDRYFQAIDGAAVDLARYDASFLGEAAAGVTKDLAYSAALAAEESLKAAMVGMADVPESNWARSIGLYEAAERVQDELSSYRLMEAMKTEIANIPDLVSPAAFQRDYFDFAGVPITSPLPFDTSSDLEERLVNVLRSSLLDRSDDALPGPPPSEGLCYQDLRISRGRLDQVGNLFRRFFGPENSPSDCFVLPDGNVNYWHIYYSEQKNDESRQDAMIDDSTIGYICGIDLPVVHVEFYAYSAASWERIAIFVGLVEERMREAGFVFEVRNQYKRGMTAGTAARLEELRMLRRDKIVNGVVTITRIIACNLIGIDPKTVKKYAPELYENWENSAF